MLLRIGDPFLVMPDVSTSHVRISREAGQPWIT
jgi:hypothetical protein